MRILAIAFAFALIGCVDETTPEGVDDFEEEFDDLGPDTHKSDVDQTEPTDTTVPLPFTQEPQADLVEVGDPLAATATPQTRNQTRLIDDQQSQPTPPSRTRPPTL